jgi:D-serine deaminase-like pyridoxal phosphate-dependent protein
MNSASLIGRSLAELPTPCLLVDADVLEANLRNMQGLVSSRGKQLRAHAKTHKCTRLARMQIDHGASGVCAAKVSEAERLVSRGIRNVLLTGPAVTDSAHKIMLACSQRDEGFIAALDSLENARRLSALFVLCGRRLKCLVDVDPGFGRTGIPLSHLAEFASSLRELPGLEVLGLQAYAGHVQHIANYEERRRVNSECLEVAAHALRHLRELGWACPIFSVGGTGSHEFDCEHPDVTEIQAGSYALMDAEYLGIGSRENPGRFEAFPPALSLLTTVVSANQRDFVTVDAGLKSLYRDGARPEVIAPGLRYEWFGDEYGKILGDLESHPLRLRDKLRLVVSHCDPTVNLFDQLFLTRAGKVEDVWDVDLRGCSQ